MQEKPLDVVIHRESKLICSAYTQPGRQAYGRVHIHITVSNGAGGDVVLNMNTSNTV